MTRAAVVLEVSNATRVFNGRGGQVRALAGVNLELSEREMVVLRGPSGCGKSTLLSLAGLLDRPDSGDVRIMGAPTSRLNADERAVARRRSIGYLFQDAGLIERMSVFDNVALPLVYAGVPRSIQVAQVVSVLAEVGMDDRLRSPVCDLSGGQRQRIGLARALIHQPALLICDEPTASLDSENGDAIIGLLRARVRAGGAVLCSSHDPALCAAADRVATMEFGAILSTARPS